MTTLESFIVQHFNEIKAEIKNGTRHQNRKYFEWIENYTDSINDNTKNKTYNKTEESKDKTTKDIIPKKPYWYLKNVSDKDVMESIHLFVHICRNSKNIGKEYDKVPIIVDSLIAMAALCENSSARINSGSSFNMQLLYTEHITQLIMKCFFDGEIFYHHKSPEIPQSDWNDKFHSRISFLKHKIYEKDKKSNISFFCDLLYIMKHIRNGCAHPLRRFYCERIESLNMMKYYLYDYIVLIYIIRHVLDRRIKPSILNIIGGVDNPDTLMIDILCFDKNGNDVSRGKDVQLFQKTNENGFKQINRESCKDSSARFRAERFKNYYIKILSGNKESKPSNSFFIDHGYVNGSQIRVVVPPEGTKPLHEVKIYDIIINPNDVFENFEDLLGAINQYADTEDLVDCVAIARPLIMLAITGNKELYKNTIKQTYDSIKEKLTKKEIDSKNFKVTLKNLVDDFKCKLDSDISNQSDVRELLELIDKAYDQAIDYDESVVNSGLSISEQHLTNVKRFVEGQILNIGTNISRKDTEIEKELAKLATILQVNKKYPELIEAEFGDRYWLFSTLFDLCSDSMFYYFSETNSLRIHIADLSSYISEKYPNRKDENSEMINICVNALTDIGCRATSDEGMAIFISLGSSIVETILRRITSIAPEDSKLLELVCQCQRDILKFLKSPKCQRNELYLLRFNNEQLTSIEKIYNQLKKIYSEISTKIEDFKLRFNEISQTKQPKGKFAKWLTPDYTSYYPTLKHDNYGVFRLSIWGQLFNYDVEDFVNILASSNPFRLNLSSISFLGISPEGLYDEWNELWNKWYDNMRPLISEFEAKIFSLTKAPHHKERELEIKYSTENEFKNMVATLILDYEIDVLKQTSQYDNFSYIKEIIEAKDIEITDKALVLEVCVHLPIEPKYYTTYPYTECFIALHVNRLFVMAKRLDYIGKKYTIFDRPKIMNKFLRYDGEFGALLITPESETHLTKVFGDDYTKLADKIRSGKMSCLFDR